ncbi:DUF6160 family protein [Acinetobacter rudis]|uniref:DUF6160 domain-containing protein n=1 Tax=Acinetobacter rudis CIP 110305 TaxID=421052 RepID=S3NW56_9GAMM|nr:DUF6160 family protein [Acinetobacter rudis]EPF70871.1 hypothetical protein F945_02918 [Acinetobacter rudis CIP 110305]
MRNYGLVLLACLASTTLHADLVALDNTALQAVEGQAGADISLKITMNQKADGSYDQSLCSDAGYCHFAIGVNNRYVQYQAGDSNDLWTKPSSESGRKLWLVFKGTQGMLNIQRLGLDGVDLRYKDKSNMEILKPSIQLSLTAAVPLQVRNFGFDAMSIEQDLFVSSATQSGSSSNAADYGYLKSTRYSGAPADFATGKSSAFDQGKEVGFMGLRMNGNMAINSKVMVFGCDAGHGRC